MGVLRADRLLSRASQDESRGALDEFNIRRAEPVGDLRMPRSAEGRRRRSVWAATNRIGQRAGVNAAQLSPNIRKLWD